MSSINHCSINPLSVAQHTALKKEKKIEPYTIKKYWGVHSHIDSFVKHLDKDFIFFKFTDQWRREI